MQDLTVNLVTQSEGSVDHVNLHIVDSNAMVVVDELHLLHQSCPATLDRRSLLEDLYQLAGYRVEIVNILASRHLQRTIAKDLDVDVVSTLGFRTDDDGGLVTETPLGCCLAHTGTMDCIAVAVNIGNRSNPIRGQFYKVAQKNDLDRHLHLAIHGDGGDLDTPVLEELASFLVSLLLGLRVPFRDRYIHDRVQYQSGCF